MAAWGNFQLLLLHQTHRLFEWWELVKNASLTQHQPQVQHIQLIIYTPWNIWKERCRRIFDNKTLQPTDRALSSVGT
jgi:hypothetical protein